MSIWYENGNGKPLLVISSTFFRRLSPHVLSVKDHAPEPRLYWTLHQLKHVMNLSWRCATAASWSKLSTSDIAHFISRDPAKLLRSLACLDAILPWFLEKSTTKLSQSISEIDLGWVKPWVWLIFNILLFRGLGLGPIFFVPSIIVPHVRNEIKCIKIAIPSKIHFVSSR